MLVGDSLGRLRDDFESQFEAVDGNRFLYRRNQRREPIPVTAEERERFTSEYLRRVRFILYGMMATLLVAASVMIWWSVATQSDLPEAGSYVGTIAIAAVSIFMMYWVKGAPSRELQGRSSVGRERTKDEVRAIHFSKISYGQLAAAAVIGVFLVLSRAAKEDVLSGWHRLWIVFGAGIVLLAGVQALRKWRFESER